LSNLSIPKSLEKRLRQASERVRRSPEAIATQAIVERLDYLEGRLSAIEAGFEDLERGNVATTQEVLSGLDRILKKHGRSRKKTA
jgi:predicted transcriptional regulator